MNSMMVFASAGSVLALAMAAGAAAHAQSQGETTTVLEDIVVTARKREESLQSVPVAVSAYSANQLERQNIREAADLGRFTPSLQTTPAYNNASMVVFALRGQVQGDNSLTNNPAVGIYLDNIAIPHAIGTGGSLFDLQRVEVLKAGFRRRRRLHPSRAGRSSGSRSPMGHLTC